MYATLPMQIQNVLAAVLIVADDNFMQYGAYKAFLQIGGCTGTCPQRPKIITKIAQPCLLLLT